MAERDDFSTKVKQTVAARAGYRCSNPDCRKHTSGPQADPSKAVNIGVAAHITAAAPGGPRYDPSLSSEQRNAIENGIWLCQSCSKLIDSDEQRYTVQLLQDWKAEAEDRAQKELEQRELADATSGGDVIHAQVGEGAQNVLIGKNLTLIQGQAVPPRPAEVDLETLAEAERRLAELPLDEIPPIATLPPGSRMPLSPNPLFVGREKNFKKLAECLKGGETVAIGQVQIAAATGLGGIGKTQLAAEFVHRYGQYFAGGVFWLSFADPAATPAEVAACGERGGLGLPAGFSSLPLEDQVRLVRSAWQSALPRLLVFDNCEEQDLLVDWRPPTGACRVLVTSRRGAWDPALSVQSLPLGVLSRAESIALLRHFQADLREDDAEAIADELGDLPLALHLAGSFLARYQDVVTAEAYLEQLRQPAPLAHRSLQAGGVSPTKHAQHVAQTFALSYERLDPDDPADSLALALLARAACFAPGQPIPRDLLRATLGEDVDLEAAEDGLLRLVALGLLEEEAEEALVLHRLVAAFVQGLEPDEGAQGAVEHVLFTEASRLNNAGYPAPLLAWQAHLRAVTDGAWEREDVLAARLCSALDFHLGMIGEYAAALPYSERALAISEKVLGPEHPYTRTVRDNLALLNDAE